ncbi:MAG: NADP-specific glutamate dehydrogenase [Clostridia bacterium]|nr:NADP-specific glutamate dehydrogenase [Clostridia bacterium]
MKTLSKTMDQVAKRNPGEPEFYQAVHEVLESLEPVAEQHPEWVEAGIFDRIVEPERQIIFRVPWVDDDGVVQVNRGFRVQFNSALGPYKGGLRFHPSVNISIIKFLGYEQTFKNSLTGLPIGGGKGGSDFDPKGKSDGEIMRFCQSFMNELYRHIGPESDVPAGDIGVGGREIGYLFGQYKKLANRFEGVLTGKGLAYGGLKGRVEATGYGIVFFVREMLKHFGEEVKGKTVVVSGFGNVAWGTINKLNELGAKVITISGPDGYILDENGIKGEKEDYLLELRSSCQDICEPYAKKFADAKFFKGKKPWEVKADIYIPCATQNEILMEDAEMLVSNGCRYICEGSNMPTTNEATAYLQKNNVIIGPAKAANAGGVACSCIEMRQNAEKTVFNADQVYKQLEEIMVRIHSSAAEASEKYGFGYNLIVGANIAGFVRVAEAMYFQGIV